MTKASGSIDLKSLKVAGGEASKYITYIDANSGIKIYDGNNESAGSPENYTQLNSNGMQVYKSSKKVADFGSRVTLGENLNNQTIPFLEVSSEGFGFGWHDYLSVGMKVYTDNDMVDFIAGEGINFIMTGGTESQITFDYMNEEVDALKYLVNAKEFHTYNKQINLGTYITVGILTSSAGEIAFSIPTGRVFPNNVTITKITGNLLVRASSANGNGIYIVKSTNGGYTGKDFDTSSTFTFYNGANQSKSLAPSAWTKTLNGGTNIYIRLASNTSHFFSGNATNTGYTNNNACSILLTNLVVYLSA